MDLKLKIYITDEYGNKVLGIGVLWLLEHIRNTGSIRKAAQEMGISYSKACRMLNSLEKSLGAEAVSRRKGGAERKGAQLTGLGEFVMERYALFQQEVKDQAKVSFKDFFAEIKEAIHGKDQ